MACASRQRILLNFLPSPSLSLSLSLSRLSMPSILYSCANASRRACMRSRRAIHRPASKDLRARFSVNGIRAHKNDGPSRLDGPSPFNYLAFYSISGARRVDVHDREARAINAEVDHRRLLLLKAPFYMRQFHLAHVIKKIKKKDCPTPAIRNRKTKTANLTIVNRELLSFFIP